MCIYRYNFIVPQYESTDGVDGHRKFSRVKALPTLLEEPTLVPSTHF